LVVKAPTRTLRKAVSVTAVIAPSVAPIQPLSVTPKASPKPVKEKKPFVITEKRQQAFEKARLKLAENRELVKLNNENYEREKAELKAKLADKRVKKLINLKRRIETHIDSESDEEIVVKTRRPRPVKAVEPIEAVKPVVPPIAPAVAVPRRKGPQYL